MRNGIILVVVKRIAIVERPHGGWTRDIILGLASYAEAMEDWELRLFTPREGVVSRVLAWEPHAIVANLIERGLADGFALFPGPMINTSVPECAPRIPLVGIDHQAIGAVAVAFFAERGFRHLHFVSSRHHPWWHGVGRGMVAASRRFDLICSSIFLETPESGERRWELAGWLKQQPGQLAVCADPELAVDLAAACRDLGRSVPGEVSILASEDHELDCQMCVPPLSAIRLAGRQAGHHCGQMISALLRKVRFRRKILLSPLGIIERRSTGVTAIHDPLVRQALRLMQERASDRLSVKELVGELSVSRRTLENRCRATTGRSPLQLIARARTERIKRALCQTDQPIQAIAARFGYPDPAQFAREFRRTAGETAADYRRRSQAALSEQH